MRRVIAAARWLTSQETSWIHPLSMPSVAVAPSSTTAHPGPHTARSSLTWPGAASVASVICILAWSIRYGKVVVERHHVAGDDGDHHLDGISFGVVNGADELGYGRTLGKFQCRGH